MTPPQTLLAGRYRLLEPIGQGGMGRVWLATDEFLTRQVAVKEVVAPQGLTAAEVRDMGARALREARAAARLSHPNVVTVYDIVVTDTAPWIVMEYLPCRSLYEVVSQDGPLPVAEAARVGLAVLTALRAAHGVGVLHRDVKPSNVLMDESGRIVLTDFGLATIVGDPSVTRSGMIIGSPSYMAPERARDAEAGEAADLWSLGATVYFAVEGRSPYDRSTALATVAALASEDPDPAVRSGRLKPVLNGLLRRNPAERLDPRTLERMLRSIARNAAPRPGAAQNVGPIPLARTAADPWSAEPFAAAPVAVGRAAAGAPVAGALVGGTASGGTAVDGTAVDGTDAGGTDAAGSAAASAQAVGSAASESAASVDAQPVAPAAAKAGMAAVGVAAPVSAKSAVTRTAQLRVWVDDLLDRRSDDLANLGLAIRPRRLWARARGDRRVWAAGIAVAVVVIAAVAWVVVRASGNPSSGSPNQPSSQAGQAASAQVSPSTAATKAGPSTAPSANLVLPVGWHMYTDSTGFSVAVDASWQVSRQGSIVYFRESGGGRVLGIDQTNKPIADPVADWRGKEQYRVGNGDFPDYQRVRLTAVDYFQKAADWEFTYLLSGNRVHVNNRGFIVSATKAYGMWWSTPANRWDEYRPQLDLIQRSFKPAS